MAPSSGHLLVPKAIRVVKFAISKTKTLIRSTFESVNSTVGSHATHTFQPIPIPIRSSQPLHPLALLRQSRSFSTLLRRHASRTAPLPPSKPTRSSLPASATARRAGTPFASTLRPNLTGGALPRTAGGYGLGGARKFSSAPVAPSQVVQNVSAGVRAFWLQGGKARFDGIDGRTGEKRYQRVSAMQEQTARTMRAACESKRLPGATVEWALSPTVTALTSLPPCGTGSARSAPAPTLGTDGLLDLLATDFARAVKDLAAVLADLKRLAVLGDLPLAVVGNGAGTTAVRLAVHFPGCDAESVERLCADVGVRRGLVRADPALEYGREAEMALLFPFAPGPGVRVGDEDGASAAEYDVHGYFQPKLRPDQLEWRGMMSPTQESLTTHVFLQDGITDAAISDPDDPFAHPHHLHMHHPRPPSSPSAYSTMHDSDYEHGGDVLVSASDGSGGGSGPAAYDGLEGIYRFLSECDGARR